MNIHFLVSENANFPSHSRMYNKHIAEGLKRKGHKVDIHHLADDFPFPSEKSLEQCRQVIATIPKSELIVADNPVFGVIPGILKVVQGPVLALVHVTFSANENLSAYQKEMILDLERDAQKYASKFIASSIFSESALARDGIGKEKIVTIISGSDHFPQKKNYLERPYTLLSIANFIRNNGHVDLIKAFTALKTKNWQLHCYGNLNLDKEYVDELGRLIRRNGLQDKVMLHSPLSGKALSDVYLNADLFIHPLAFDEYSNEVVGALAHGIPVIVSTGGGNSEIVPAKMGKFFKPGVVYLLQTIIDELLENSILYKKLAGEASTYHKQAPSWETSIDQFEQVLGSFK